MSEIEEQRYAAKLMLQAAENGANVSLKLAAWFVSACGAALSLLFVNLDATLKFIPLSAFKVSVTLIATAALIHIFQRYLAALVLNAVESAKSAEIETTEFSEQFSFDSVFDQIERATFWPSSVLVQRSFAAIKSGDYAANARVLYKASQIQGWCAVIQMLFGAAAILWVVYAAQA